MFPLFDANPHRRTPKVVVVLIALNLAVFVVELLQASPRMLEVFVTTWGFVPAELWRPGDGRVWLTPITAMFLHGGWLHLLGNCWFLWVFGKSVEGRIGLIGFALFYVTCGLGAAALQVAVDPTSVVPMIGASGAISGVLGAYARYFPRIPIFTVVPLWFAPILPIPAFVFVFVWFGLQFWNGVDAVFSTTMAGGVAWWAHIGGFLTGWILCRQSPNPRRVHRRQI